MSAEGTERARVCSCEHCGRPIVQPVAGPRAGIWLHTDGIECCRDPWGDVMPVTATPRRPWGTPAGPPA